MLHLPAIWRTRSDLRCLLPRLLRLLIPCALSLSATASLAQSPPAGQRPDFARVIVKYRAGGSLMRQALQARNGTQEPRHAAALGRRLGLALIDGRALDERMQVLHARGVSSRQLAQRLAADAEVEYAVPDERRRALAVPSDPLFAGGPRVSPAAGQWYLRTPDATQVSAINAVGAWAISTGAPDLVVAVLDTGIRPDHPDLARQLVAGYDFIADADEARDGDGRDPDPSDPGDWSAAGQCDAGEPAADSSWHGTKMAGLIGAQTGNRLGMASVGYGARVQPVRVLGPCGGYDSDILAAMLWAGGLGSNPVRNATPARVINLSLGSAGVCSSAYRDTIGRLTAAGVVIVAAAGNEEGLAVGTPGNCPGVIAVTGLRHIGTKVGFSSLGPQVTIAAPGGNCVNLIGDCLYPILTTTNTGRRGPAENVYTDSRDYSVGTSYATALVSGAVALMLSANPTLGPAQVREHLQATARPFVAAASAEVPQCRLPDGLTQDECVCTTSTCGAGMLDAEAAVRAAAATTGGTGGAGPGPGGGGGSGGGGALEPGWAIGLAAMLAALLASRPPAFGAETSGGAASEQVRRRHVRAQGGIAGRAEGGVHDA